MRNIFMLEEYKFKSEATGAINYVCAFMRDDIIYYSDDYYLMNGGHRPLNSVRLKDVREAESRYNNRAYIYLTRALEEQFKKEDYCSNGGY